MTNTVTSTNGSRNGSKPRPKRAGKQVRHRRAKPQAHWHRRGLGLLTPLVGQEFLDKYGLRDPLNRTLRYGAKQVFSAAGASTRQFKTRPEPAQAVRPG